MKARGIIYPSLILTGFNSWVDDWVQSEVMVTVNSSYLGSKSANVPSIRGYNKMSAIRNTALI